MTWFVERRQQRPRFGLLALLLPEASEARGCAQFQGLGVLVAGKVESLLETLRRFHHVALCALLAQ